MPVHKLLRGANAGLYLPFALGRLRAMEAIDPEGFFSEQYLIGGYFVRIRQAREERYIDISAVLASYEFFTSEHVMQSPLASPGHTYADNGIGSFVCGSGVRATFNRRMVEAKGHHLASSSLVPLFDQDWRQVSCEVFTGPENSYGFLTWPAWQNQKFHEHTWHPNNDGLSLVTSCQAQMPGHNNQGNWGSPYTGWRIANGGARTADQGFDVLPAYYDGSGTTWAGPQMDHEYTWWRHAAVAKSDRGNKFFVCTDNYGRFQVYRVRSHHETNGIVEIGHYKMVTPPYPGWVTVPAPGDPTKYVNHWTWRFNRDATKCVTCPFNSVVAPFKTYLNGFLFGASILPEDVGDFTPPECVVDAHEDTVGLLEFGLAIVETGDGELDFTVTFTVLRQSYFGTASPARWFLDAAYALPNVPGVAEDTLVTLEMECRVPAGNYQPSSTLTAGFDTYYYLDAFWGARESLVVNTNNEALAPTEKLRFITHYPAAGKFPTLETFRTQGHVVGIPWSASLGLNLPLAAGGTRFVPWAGPVGHDPDNLAGSPVPIGSILGFLHAIELATLSWCYAEDNYITGQGRFRAQSHGVMLYSSDYSLGPPKTDYGYNPTEPVPSARIHQCAASGMLSTELGQCFSVHPAGHFSFAATATLQAIGGGEALDWVSVVGQDEEGNPLRTRFRHKDLFNEAFGQNRQYSFYWEDFPGKTYFDQGSFRTHGIWVTFR